MASTRTICTECKSVVTLPEPAEVGDVVTCPKCEAYFTVPRTKIVPTPGAAKPAQAAAKPVAAVPAKPKPKVEVDDEDDLPPPPKKKPVVVVEEDDDEDEERPKKKKKSGGGSGGRKKKKKKRKDEEKSFKDSPVRYAILGVLVLIMLVAAFFLYKKMMKGDPPEIVIQATEPDVSKPITKEEIEANRQKAEKAKANNQGPKTGLRSVDRQKATNSLKQLVLGYFNHSDALGKPPAKPSDLLVYTENNAALIKDVEDGVYVVFMNVRLNNLPNGASNTILGYYHDVPQKGGMVMFADGSVRQMNVAEFEAAPKAGK
jgi:D-Tyr-tRNAtyr deacylase